MMFLIRIKLCILCLIFQAWSVTIYDEFQDGSLSDSVNAPTVISTLLVLGENIVSGRLNEPSLGRSSQRADVFTVTVPDGFVLTSLVYTEANTTGSSSDAHFLAFHDSTGSFNGIENALFATLVSGDLQDNILPLEIDGGDVAEDNGQPTPRGYELPLPSGDYTLWFQETDRNVIFYDFTFTITTVPEPSMAIFALVSGIFLIFRRRRNTIR